MNKKQKIREKEKMKMDNKKQKPFSLSQNAKYVFCINHLET